MEYEIYYDLYHEFIKLMKHLGKYISYPLKDVEDKANDIKNNTLMLSGDLKLFKKNDAEYKYLTNFMKLEIKLGIYNLNTDNNKELTDKAL